MSLRADARIGLTMLAWRSVLRAQAGLGDPVAKMLVKGPNTPPYPIYDRIRTLGELPRSRMRVHVTASHGVVNSILRDGRFGVQTARGNSPDYAAAIEGGALMNPIDASFLSLDPPRHTRLRRLVAPWFTPRALRERTGRIDAIVARFLDELAGRDRFDLIDDFAVRVPVQVICDLLGVPDDEYPRFLRWGAAVALSLDSTWTLREYRRLRAALTEMHAFFEDLLARRRTDPADDLVSHLATAEHPDEGPVTAADLVATTELLLVAGFETTVNLIGNGTQALLRHPEVRDWLLADPDRIDDVVEEVLRYDPPVQYTMRMAHEPVEVAGVRLPVNGPVILLLAGAGRDPAVFEHPERFDPTRPNNRDHLAFSAGIHYCLGAGLARIEAAAALRALFERYPELRIAGSVTRRRSRNINGVRRLPVRGTPVPVRVS